MSGSRLNSKGAASLFQKGPVTYPNDRKGPAPPGRIGTAEKPELSVNEATASGLSRSVTRAVPVQFHFLKQAGVALASVRFGAHYGLKSDIGLSPKSAKLGHALQRRRGACTAISWFALRTKV